MRLKVEPTGDLNCPQWKLWSFYGGEYIGITEPFAPVAFERCQPIDARRITEFRTSQIREDNGTRWFFWEGCEFETDDPAAKSRADFGITVNLCPIVRPVAV